MLAGNQAECNHIYMTATELLQTKSILSAYLLMTQGKAKLTPRQVAYLPVMERKGLIISKKTSKGYVFQATAKLKQLAA